MLPIPTNLKRVTKQNKKGIKQERFGTFEEKQAIRKKLLELIGFVTTILKTNLKRYMQMEIIEQHVFSILIDYRVLHRKGAAIHNST